MGCSDDEEWGVLDIWAVLTTKSGVDLIYGQF